jgi:spore maturation protein SpmB
MNAVVGSIGGITGRLGLPAEALPMALMRPLSGSGAYGILASIINDPAIGPDSYIGYLVSTLQGSTETTFYVLAVYFGAVQVRRIRHSLAAALTADASGVIFAVLACSFFLG